MAARIIVINDIEEILDAFRLILEDAGYEVMLSGLAFRDTHEIERLQPDLIILDYIFGAEKLGWQMVQLLRMNPTTAKIPIIVSTAATREVRDIEPEMMSKGIRLLPKPFDIDELLEMVRQILEDREKHPYLSTRQEPPSSGSTE